jgi:hypothetical protein
MATEQQERYDLVLYGASGFTGIDSPLLQWMKQKIKNLKKIRNSKFEKKIKLKIRKKGKKIKKIIFQLKFEKRKKKSIKINFQY